MERLVIFRDFQEQVAADHTNIQEFARQTFDHIINDVVTKTNRYSGSQVIQTAQAEVKVSPGRLYHYGGAIFNRSVETTQSMVPYLAAASERIVAVSVYGVENLTNQQERDFLVNTDTGETRPDAVAMTRSRDAVLVFTSGAESADPQPPPVPVEHALIALIRVNTLGVVSVTMQTQFAVASTENLDQRARLLEAFRAAIEPRVSAIASDLSALKSQAEGGSTQTDLLQLYQMVDELRRRLDVPALATDVFEDKFATEEFSDVDNAAGLGYDAIIDTGLRFPLANASVKSLNIFSANDPNASLAHGMLLPRFAHELKIQTGDYHSDLGIAQYGWQTTEIVQRTVSKTRIRYGGYWNWFYPYYYVGFNPYSWRWSGTYLYPVYYPIWRWVPSYWYETYEETYTDVETIEHSIVGALVGQSFLNANDIWATQLGFYVTTKAANEDVWVTLCEVTNGQPDKHKAILVQAYPHASIVTGWNRMTIPPTFLESGKRYALVFVSNANHRFGMASGQSYLDGTFFYSTDGEYYLGDLTKDLMIQVWGAKFENAQVAIELEALNLDGGIDSLDIEAAMVSPGSADVVFEVQPGGTGAWLPLNETNVNAFSTMPPLCRFRIRFVGTRDMHVGIRLPGSEVRLARPKVLMKHVSDEMELSSPSDEIRVRYELEGFDPVSHAFDCKLRVGGSTVEADVEEFILRNADAKRYEVTFRFDLGSTTSACRVISEATTMAANNLFHANKRLLWAQ